MSTLYIVATPIGNLEDITLRAVRILKEVDVIACEDTRQTQKLLQHFDIHNKLISYHQNSSAHKTEGIVEMLKEGKSMAVVTDGGTPGISDPGWRLVNEVQTALGDRVSIVPIPGPSAVITAASVAGIPVDEFMFIGFLPHKKRRNSVIKEIADSERTVIFYESPYRIKKAMTQLVELCDPERRITVCRELTKKFETLYTGTVKDVAERILAEEPRGEYVVVVGRV